MMNASAHSLPVRVAMAIAPVMLIGLAAFAPGQAQAYEPTCTTVAECQTEMQQREDYFAGVIASYQAEVEYQRGQAAYWQQIEEQVSANFDVRSQEYATALAQNYRLRARVERLRVIIHDLRDN